MSARPRKKRRLRTMTVDEEDQFVDGEEEEECDEDYFFNNPHTIITQSPEIIRLILRGLSLRCLKKCSLVCKSWKFYADKIIKERQSVRTFIVTKLSKSNWTNWQPVADIKEVANYFQVVNIFLSVYYKKHVENFVKFLCVKEIDIDAKFILLFGKLPLSRPCVGGNDILNLRLILPPDCPIVGCLSSAGIIGTDVTAKTYDLQNPRFDCFSCLSFPKIDGLEIRRFHLTLERYQHEFQSRPHTDLQSLFGIGPADRVKCLILVCPSYYPFELSKEIFAAFYQRENGRIAMAGGVCEDIIEATPDAHEIAELGLTGFAFCGDERVSAGSFIVPSKAKSKKAIETAIYKTTKGQQLINGGRKSFGFIFTCCGRGTHIFKTSGVETGLIKDKFPNTPFVGAFSLGECGVNYWPTQETTDKKNNGNEGNVNAPEFGDVLYSYTSTVAIVSVSS